MGEEDPHATIVTSHQHPFEPIDVWATIMEQHFNESFEFPRELNEGYLGFLKNNFHNY